MLPSRSKKLGYMVLFISLLGIINCAGIGSKGLPEDRRSYNIAIQESNDQQMLLNLVRLKYRDNPYFLEVSNVVDRFSYSLGANASASLPISGKNVFGLGGNTAVSANPTISYSPLTGENLGKRFLSRVDLETLFILLESGWKIDRIFRICIERMGELINAESASGPTPSRVPEYKTFLKLANTLRKLQVNKALDTALVTKEKQNVLYININPDKAEGNLKIVNEILGLPADNASFFLTTQFINDPRAIVIRTRPLRGILYYLTHATSVPEEDIEKGFVTHTVDESGNPFDWNEVTGDLLKVHHDYFEPADATITTHYRHQWFYIKDSDLESKATFHLLTEMFNLLAGGIKTPSPLFTIDLGK
jgi:hypothetical protein